MAPTDPASGREHRPTAVHSGSISGRCASVELHDPLRHLGIGHAASMLLFLPAIVTAGYAAARADELHECDEIDGAQNMRLIVHRDNQSGSACGMSRIEEHLVSAT